MKPALENRVNSQASRSSKAKQRPVEPAVIIPAKDKLGMIIGEKNCFVEIQKRSFYSGIYEPQDIYLGRQQQYGQSSGLFIPTDKKDQMIAHEAELLPPCPVEERDKGLGRVDLTDEALDDWIAQSMNRSLPEILDPKKKFNIPVQVTDDDEEETFLRGLLDDDNLDRKMLEERKRQFNRRKRQNNNESFSLHQTKSKHFDLKIDSKKLEPKILKGTAIQPPQVRLNASMQGGTETNPSTVLAKISMSPMSSSYNPRAAQVNQQNRRRQQPSSFDDSSKQPDIRLSQKLLLQDEPINQGLSQLETAIANTNNSYKLFSLNMSNFLRQNNAEKDIETSLAERELNYIKVVLNRQYERKQREEQSKEMKKQSVEHFRDIQKQNRKELSRLTAEAIAYCHNPPELPSYYQTQIPSATQPTNDRRPKTNQSQRNQSATSATNSKRFFILTKLQSKPGTAESGSRRRGNSMSQVDQSMKMNTTSGMRNTFFSKSQRNNNDGRPSTTATYGGGQGYQNESNGFNNFRSDFMHLTAGSTNNVKEFSQNNNNRDASVTKQIKNQHKQDSDEWNNSNEMSQSQNLFYSSLRSYKQQRETEFGQRFALKEQTDDYINIDANRSTTVVKFNPNNNLTRRKNHSFAQNNRLQSDREGDSSNSKDLNGSVSGSTGTSFKAQQDLPEKVERLLNSGSEDCLIKPNDDFANLVLHLEELKASEKKPESQMNNSEFWLHKSWKLIDEGQNEVATQCLKQVLIVDKLHFKSIFNMGSLYEKIKKFKTALAWLQISQEFEPSHEQTLYGISLCLYKMRRFEESYEQINELIDLIKDKDEPPSKYIYLRALCLKQAGRIDEAEDDYKIFYKKTSPKNFDLLMHFMMLFAFKYRNKIAKYQDLEIKYSGRTFCNFHSAIQQIIQGEYFEIQLADFYSESQKTWINFEALIQRISGLSFFKRFAHSLLRKAIPHMNYNLIEKEKLINPMEDEIFIIIAGNVQVFDHTKDYEKPDIVSYYSEGDIIGCDHLEHNLSRQPNVWLITQTPVELLKMDKTMFFDLWKGQYSLEGEKITSLLKNCPMLKGISDISLLKLSYELVEIKEFKKGELIYNDGTYLESMNYNYIEMRKCGKKRGVGIVKRIVEKMTTITSSFSRITKFRKLYLKHRQKIRSMMWSTMLIKGLFIIVDGIVEIENDKNWSYHLTPGDFFGENLMFKVKALANFGRMRAASNTARLLFLPREYFNRINSLDMALMKKNCKKREQIDNIEYLANRYNQVRELKLQRKRDEEDKKESLFTDEEYIAQSF